MATTYDKFGYGLAAASNDDKDLALNEKWFALQWATTTMINSASVRL